MPGGGSSKTTSIQELSPEQKTLIGMVIPTAQNYMKTPLKLYPNSTVPGFNKQQLGAQKSMLDVAKNVTKTATAGSKTATNLAAKASSVAGGGANTAFGSLGQLFGLSSMFGNQGGNAALGAAKGLGQGTGYANKGLGGVLADYNQSNKTRDMFMSGDLMDPNKNPALKGTIQAAIRPINEQLTRQVLPGIRSDFAGGNSFGSSRQGIAEGLAIQGGQNAAKDATSSVVNNAYNQGLGATLQSLGQNQQALSAGIGQGYGAGASAGGLGASIAGLGTQGLSSAGNIGTNLFNFGNQGVLGGLSQLPNMAQLAFMGPAAQGAVGQQQYALQQGKLNEAKSNFNTKQMLPFLQAQDVANLAMGLGGGSAVTNSQQPNNWGGTLMGLGQLGMLGYGLGMFS